MYGIDAGRLDRSVTIRRITGQTAGALGQPEPVWSDLATVRAQMLYRAQQAEEERWREADAQKGAVTRRVFRIRWGLGVTPMDRLMFEGREFEITEVDEVGRRTAQDIRAVARAE